MRRRRVTASLRRQLRRGQETLRTDTRTRARRLQGKGWQIAQCSIGAAVSYYIASEVLGHEQAFFAPVATMVALGLNFGARLARVIEVVIGVAIGVLVGDVLVALLGQGPWLLPLVVALAMSVAVLAGVGAIMSTQAGVQAVLVTVLLPDPSQALTRWFDALVGGAVALAIAAFAPSHPLRRPRQLAAEAVREVGSLLSEAVVALAEVDLQRASRLLERARNDQQSIIDELQDAAQTGLDMVTLAPWLHRGHRHELRHTAEVSVPLDYALRNTRVLLRRVVALNRRGSPVDPALVALIDAVAQTCEALAAGLEDPGCMDTARKTLREAAVASARVPVGRVVSADAMLEQCRAIIIDLLQVGGLSLDDAYAAMPRVEGSWQTPAMGERQVEFEAMIDDVADSRDGKPAGRNAHVEGYLDDE